MAKELVLLSGLGADQRVFENLGLESFTTIHIRWIDPLEKESIEDYAKRIIDQIAIPNPILIGVSFGGMMAVEIGKQIEISKIILISSAVTHHEIPWYFKLAGRLGINRLMPVSLLKKVTLPAYWVFGVSGNKEKELLKSFINETPNHFLKWAIDKIVHWKNEKKSSNVIHISGSKDRLLPNSKPDFVIHNGGHLMIINRADEIRSMIMTILQSN